MPATSGVPGRAAGGTAGSTDPGARWRRVFPGDQPQLAVLRRWLNSLLPDCASRDDIVCVATELSTNAVLHTATGQGGWFAVELTWYGPVMRVAVADCGGAGEPQVIHDPDGEHGRGLAVVEGLAAGSGFLGDHHSRLVWADVPWDQACGPAGMPVAPRLAGRPAANGSNRAEAASLSA